MVSSPLGGRAALVTGAAVRVGRAIALALAEAGADVIVGHHAHVAQPVEVIGGTLVLYGLGNLLFDVQPERAIAEWEASAAKDLKDAGFLK